MKGKLFCPPCLPPPQSINLNVRATWSYVVKTELSPTGHDLVHALKFFFHFSRAQQQVSTMV